jgi:hypothetical protein
MLRVSTLFLLTLFLLILVTACGGGTRPPDVSGSANAPLLLAAGGLALEPSSAASWTGGLDLARLGISGVSAVYDVTTPAGEPFVIEALSRAAENVGDVRLSVAHAADDSRVPQGGPETLSDAGVLLSGAGQAAREVWMDTRGDGFAHVRMRGSIERDQILAVAADVDGEQTTILLRVRLGLPSVINVAAQGGADYPGVLLEQTIYSSNSWRFGLPTIAVSGDRTSVVCYEGDRAEAFRPERYELRLQHDALTGAVTGGAVVEANPDAGNWRDHEVAALFNVLAILRGGSDRVELGLSFDRGASIGQLVGLGPTAGGYRPRLVQVAIALDYSLAVLFWRAAPDGRTELVLVEGRPSAVDGGGSPTAFLFDPPAVLHRAGGDVTPMLMGAAWSVGGDLVIGYAYTSFESAPDRTWTSLTQNRCIVRRFGGERTDTLVEESRLVGKDPSVAVTGAGPTLRIFYAYEGTTGVRLTTSDDGGLTFAPPQDVGDPSAHMPTVIAREGPGGTRLDLLHLVQASEGTELHVRHWPAYESSQPVDYRLSRAVTEGGGVPLPPVGGGAFAPPEVGFRITQVAWLGYDAVLDGDEIVVVYDEETFDGYELWPVIDFGGPVPAAGGGGVADPFVPAVPPPLAPGLTEPVAAPDPLDRHQLRLLRLP